MIEAHSVSQVRHAEAELLATLPDGVLMQRAAHGLGCAVIEYLGGAYGRRVLVLAGSGDNGGDGLYAGAMLSRRGAKVDALLLSDHAHPGAVEALRSAGGRVVAAPASSSSYDVVVDGIVGIGGRTGLRDDAVAALAQVADVPLIAVDTPSGVGVDSGEIDGPHVSADLTVTFGTHKACHLLDPAAIHAGVVQLVDLGLGLPPPTLEALQPVDVARLLPRPAPDSHKYTRGVVGVRAGSDTYPGAGLLSVAGASCGLAGMVRYVGPDGVADLVRSRHPEVVGAGRVQAWVVGSGSDGGAAAALSAAVGDDVPVVVDADALAHASQARGRQAILTPHAGELARMLDVERTEVEARPAHYLRTAVESFDCTVLLKGRRSLTAAPGRPIRVTLTGTPWLATAGAGDVLGGLIGSLLAAGLDPYDAASVGSWLHGAAATRAAAGGPLVAGEIAPAVSSVIATLG